MSEPTLSQEKPPKVSPAGFDVIKPMDDALTEPLCNDGEALLELVHRR